MADTTTTTTTTTTDASTSSSSSSSAPPADQPIGFSDIDADQMPTEMESLCMNCGENGTTRMLLTRIPHFRELIVMAFDCPHCNYRNNEVQFGGSFQERGTRYSTTLTTPQDLNRQVVKSDTGRVIFPAIAFEIPALAQRGQLNTVEGVLSRAIDGLSESQPIRRETEPEVAAKIDDFIKVLESYKSGAALPFPIIVDDIAGNSHLENPYLPNPDPHMEIVSYVRTKEQDMTLGMVPVESRTDIATTGPEAPATSSTAILSDEEAAKEFAKASEEKEVLTLPGACHSCHQPGEVRMVVTDIPYFKEVILMAFACDYCGYKSNEVKSGGAIPPKGKRIAVRLENFPLDLNRDILKSQSAGLVIPELNFELGPGTLGGKFTTVEGLLQSAKDQLENTPFIHGDSADRSGKSRMDVFLEELQECIEGKRPFTLIIDDPLANSFVQNVYAPDEDPAIVEEEYERTEEQNEALGLLDMKTEDY